MGDRLDGLQTFLRVYDARSFSVVARDLGVSQPTISKRIAEVEAHFGVQLFTRSTRQIHPTADAVRLYDHARHIADQIELAEASVGRRSEQPGGLLRITVPSFFGRAHIIPRLPRYYALNDKVRIDIRMTDQIVDLVAAGIDLGIRVGEVTTPTLVARRIGSARQVLVASPDYLRRFGEPRIPEELTRHACIVYSGFKGPDRLVFESEFGRRVVRVTGVLHLDSADGMRDAALAGIGVTVIPAWDINQVIAEGRLKVLLPDYPAASMPINIIYPETKWLAPRARSFIDFLAAEFADPAALQS
jgi:DNA-binding transcriptional LysR family regulator